MNLPEENKRVKKIIDQYFQGNETRFSKEIGISQPRINRLFSIDSRSNKYPLVSFEIVQSIINKFVDINSEWLITGKGEMLKSAKKNIDSSFITSIDQASSTREVQKIPLFDLENSEKLVPHRSNLVKDFIWSSKFPICDGATTVKGDSMEPLLKNGDILFYKQISCAPKNIFFGEMYLLSIKISTTSFYKTVRIVQMSEHGNQFLKMTALNPTYQPKDIEVNQIVDIAIVKAFYRSLN